MPVPLLFLFFTLFQFSPAIIPLPETCRIFCSGELLEAIQTAKLFKDSKHFVDMPLKFSPNETLTAFAGLRNRSDPKILHSFVHRFFQTPGTELEACHPPDFVAQPQGFRQIHDPIYRLWAYQIHNKWRVLCRRVKEKVRQNSDRHSLISVPHSFVAPGGRFREYYYWDSFWIIKGLLASEMQTTAKNMIRNFAEMVHRFGFVPNGGRIYYLNRSQPPMLSSCVSAYFEASSDVAFVREMMPLLEKEMEFWKKQRSVLFQTEKLYRYLVKVSSPRPEAFTEDQKTAGPAETSSGKAKIWSEIATTAESGWDFSSRWFQNGSLSSVRTTRILPVDLNAFICGSEKILSKLHGILGNETMRRFHLAEFQSLRDAIHRIFWDEAVGSWFDVDFDSGLKTLRFYASNLTPLFTGCVHHAKVGRRSMEYLKSSGADSFPGGLPTSLQETGQQWDLPNGWAPTNHMIIDGLRRHAHSSRDSHVSDIAFSLANRWIQTNYFVYARTGVMFEKYDVVSEVRGGGGGGEYEAQEGFGWSNGVVLDLLLKYGDRLRAPPTHSFFAK